MVVIKKYDGLIPVDFGEFTLTFDSSDKSIQQLVVTGESLQKSVEDLKDTQDGLEQLYQLGKKTWTELFDESVFEKVYDFSGKSSIATVLYLIQTVVGIVEEMSQRNNDDAFSKYLTKK